MFGCFNACGIEILLSVVGWVVIVYRRGEERRGLVRAGVRGVVREPGWVRPNSNAAGIESYWGRAGGQAEEF